MQRTLTGSLDGRNLEAMRPPLALAALALLLAPGCLADMQSEIDRADQLFGASTAPACVARGCGVGAITFCGTIPDGCGGVLLCGGCPVGSTCGAAVANICAADGCSGSGKECGSGCCAPLSCLNAAAGTGMTCSDCGPDAAGVCPSPF